MKKYSYCVMHDTYPSKDEPCWACIHQFGCDDLLSIMNSPVAKKKGPLWSRFSNKVKYFLNMPLIERLKK